MSEIVSEWQQTIQNLRVLNKDVKVIFTVSPIRHLKDGAANNNLSKSILRLAVDELISNDNMLSYFPSFEIMMDELRDYRFYKEDLVHPSEIAIKYIMERFSDCYFNKETKELIKQVQKIMQFIEHRPFNPESEIYKEHKRQTSNKIKQLLETYPNINFDNELEYLG